MYNIILYLYQKHNLDEEHSILLEKYNSVCSLNIEFSQQLTDINGEVQNYIYHTLQRLKAEKKYEDLMKDYNTIVKKCSDLEKTLRARDLMLNNLNSYNELSRRNSIDRSRRSSVDFKMNPH